MKIFATLALALVLAFPSVGLAKGKGKGGKDFGKMMKELNLSKEQKEKFTNLKKEHREELKGLMKQKMEKKKALNEALNKDTSDSDLKELHEEVWDVKEEISEKQFEHLLAIRKLLTPEQRKKFSDKKSHRLMGKGGKKRGKQE